MTATEVMIFLGVFYLLAGPAYLALAWSMRWRLERVRRKALEQMAIPTLDHVDIPMRHGTIGIRSWRTRVAIVDFATNTVLAAIDRIPRVGEIVSLTQNGAHFTLTVADNPEEPGTPILTWNRPIDYGVVR